MRQFTPDAGNAGDAGMSGSCKWFSAFSKTAFKVSFASSSTELWWRRKSRTVTPDALFRSKCNQI